MLDGTKFCVALCSIDSCHRFAKIQLFIPKPHLRVAKNIYSEVPGSNIFCCILQEVCRLIMCLYMSPCISDCDRTVRRIRTHPSRSFPIHAQLSSGMYKSRATKCCALANNVCGSSVWNWFRVTRLTPLTLISLLFFFYKIYAPLANLCVA